MKGEGGVGRKLPGYGEEGKGYADVGSPDEAWDEGFRRVQEGGQL